MAASEAIVSMANVQRAHSFMNEAFQGINLFHDGQNLWQCILTDAIRTCLHPMVQIAKAKTLSLHALNGPLVKYRGSAITTSYGHILWSFKKTNKTSFNGDADAILPFFEAHVNRENFVFDTVKEQLVAVGDITVTHLKDITPEEFLAQMDPDKPSRKFFGVIVCHSEFAPWGEQLGLLSPGKAKGSDKARMGSLNEAIDMGRVSKLHRDSDKNFGKDVGAVFSALTNLETGGNGSGALPMVMYHHLTGLNVKDAAAMLAPGNTLATNDRYRFITCPVTSPYDDPPAEWVAPPEAVQVNLQGERELRRDSAGFLRDALRTPGIMDADGMLKRLIRCYDFVHKLPNRIFEFDDEARALLRQIDANNWQMAGLVQYLDEAWTSWLRVLCCFLRTSYQAAARRVCVCVCVCVCMCGCVKPL
jgi:hypothetical protein